MVVLQSRVQISNSCGMFLKPASQRGTSIHIYIFFSCFFYCLFPSLFIEYNVIVIRFSILVIWDRNHDIKYIFLLNINKQKISSLNVLSSEIFSLSSEMMSFFRDIKNTLQWKIISWWSEKLSFLSNNLLVIRDAILVIRYDILVIW